MYQAGRYKYIMEQNYIHAYQLMHYAREITRQI